ncbi:hypothetical protein BH11PSE13_BH11PSE13_20500 [soil metagenome]
MASDPRALRLRCALRWFAGVLVIAASMASTHSAEPQKVTRPFGESVGLGVKFLQGQPLDALPMLGDLKVKWVREHVNWAAVELAPGRYGALQDNLRKQLAYYRANDIGVVALLTLSNGKTAPQNAADVARDADPAAFGRFAAEAARLLKAEGVRFVLEVGNEPHNSFLVKALGGQWQGKAPSPWLDHYVRMVNAAVKEVKAMDPTVKVIAGDDMWVIDYWLLEGGLDPRLDGLTVHPYTPGIPEITAIANDTDWVRPFVAVDPDRSFQSAFARLRAAALKRQGRPLEIWVTEMGWPVAEGASPVKGSVPERTAAAYIPRSFILAAEAGVQGFLWFSSNDSVDGPMGLTRNDKTQRLTYGAFKTMTSELGTLRFSRRLLGGQGTSAAGQAFLFTDDRVNTVVAWQATGSKDSELVIPQVGAEQLMATDFLGRQQALQAKDGAFAVALSGEPVYVRFSSGATQLPQITIRSMVAKANP